VSHQIISFPRLARQVEEPVLFRRVEILDAVKQETIVFRSNLLAFGATTIAAIYKDRWQVELFIKALKQTMKSYLLNRPGRSGRCPRRAKIHGFGS